MRLLASQGSPEFLSSIPPKDLLERIKMSKSGDTSASAVTITKIEKDETSEKSEKGGKDDKKGKDKKGKEKEKQKVKAVEKVEDARGVGAPGEWSVLEEEGGVSLYTGKPGRECGVVVDASSYFDR
jgi:hypothetical protein